MPASNPPAQPLSELETRILMILAEGDLHGYGIAKRLQAAEPDGPRILPTNLYRRLHELVDRGLIDHGALETDESGRPRKNFRLTNAGRASLADAAARLAALVSELQSRGLISPEGA